MNDPVPQPTSAYGTSGGSFGVVDVLVVIDRSGFGPADGEYPPIHPMDKLVDCLGRRLKVFKDVEPYAATTDEIAPDDIFQVPSYGVVTNDRGFAEWCRSGGGNLVEIDYNEDSLAIRSQGQTQEFAIADVDSAAVYAADMVKPPSDQGRQEHDSGPVALDTGPALLEPMTLKEFHGTESILSELWQAIDNDELSGTQQHQVIAMAELLDSQRRSTAPNSTERWILIALFRALFTYLLEHFPQVVSLWEKLVEILHEIGWMVTAGLLPI